MLTVYNMQRVTVCERSELVKISDRDINILRSWHDMPFDGSTSQELLHYIKFLFKSLDEGELDLSDCPKIIVKLYVKLSGNIKRSEMWNSRKPGSDSLLVAEEKNAKSAVYVKYRM